MTLKLSFSIDQFALWEEIFAFITESIHFEPKTIRAPKIYPDYEEFEEKKAVGLLIQQDPNMLDLADGFYNYHDEHEHLFVRKDVLSNTLLFFFSSVKSINQESKDHIISIARKKGFVLAYYYNELNVLDQNEAIISNLIYRNKTVEHLKKKWDPLLEREVIDIFQNPGHEKLTFENIYMQDLKCGLEIWRGNILTKVNCQGMRMH